MIKHWLANAFDAIRHQPFIAASGFAALLHSTWAISTLFHGAEPQPFSLDWFAWVVAGFAFAFAVDVGQISMSSELRTGERTPAKYAAFAFLAVLSYYFQWVYLIAHAPLIELGAGVAPVYVAAVQTVRDFAIWLVPGLLPISTVLYTFSYGKVRRPIAGSQRVQTSANRSANGEQAPRMAVQASDMPKLQSQNVASLPEPESIDAMWIAECPKCGWRKPCETERKMINSLNAHQRYCTANVER